MKRGSVLALAALLASSASGCDASPELVSQPVDVGNAR